MSTSDFEQRALGAFAEQAYLDYAMYVILDRALPSLADGLKPVQRRIVYAMSELGLKASAKHKKSARTVGDVLGKFHPHGDSACYEAMVLMAQSFSYRYPLIDGQGNWGSIDDPKSFAAMRYTEARLTPYAQNLLQELGQGTIDWQPNFDGTLKEPTLLPARLPNVLLNGASGIAVGMATDIPPHNIREVAQALIALLDNPKLTLEELLTHLPGPDFPTGGVCMATTAELHELYVTGRGSLKLRAAYRIEENLLIIDALPYQASASKIMQQIAQQMQQKKLPMLEDLRDESDQEHPVRLVLELRSKRSDHPALMQHLFATTDLERSLRVNLNVINLQRRPQVMGLKALLSEWLVFRQQTLTRRLEHRLAQVEKRLHIVEGLMIIFLHIDTVIAIIRHEDHPAQVLAERFQLSDEQVEAILSIRLRQLAKIEELALQQERDDLMAERDQLHHLLDHPAALKKLLKSELKDDAQRYDSPRRTQLQTQPVLQAQRLTPQTPTEPVTVMLSANGWIRCAKGHNIDPTQLNHKAGDHAWLSDQGHSNQPLILLDAQGRSYRLWPDELPSARGLGDPLTKYLKPAAPIAQLALTPANSHVLLMKSSGYGLLAPSEALATKNKAGRQSLTLEPHASILPPLLVPEGHATEETYLALATAQGRLLLMAFQDIPILDKGKGNKLIHIDKDDLAQGADSVVAACLVGPSGIAVHTSGRHCKWQGEALAPFIGPRGRRGQKLPRGFQQVAALKALDDHAS